MYIFVEFRLFTSSGCSWRLVQWRRNRLGRTIRCPDRGLENGRADEQTSMWRRCCRIERFTLRRRRTRWPVVPQQY